MPTETFLKLPEEKRKKIIIAAKREFARVPLVEASIKNIVEQAEIARGSFYQYFDSKEDLLGYILKSNHEEMEHIIEQTIEQTRGDIFKIFEEVYTYMIQKSAKEKDADFYQQIFENVKTSEDAIFAVQKEQCIQHDFTKYYDIIDKEKLKVHNQDDLRTIIKMLFIITRKAVVNHFKYESEEVAKKEYLKELEYLKYGVLK